MTLGLILLALATPSILISGGSVLDGSGHKAVREDVRVQGDRIVEVGRLSRRPNETVIDARGEVVCPGFIDAHSHADGEILTKSDASVVVRQGITTSVVGQDGSSHFPIREWIAKLNATPHTLNLASFVGHGTARSQILGKNANRPATPEEIHKMAALVDSEMRAGLQGLSSGLEYDPGYYSATEELIELAKAASKHHGIYISHVRDEENKAIQSFTELIQIAREAHLPAQISHIKLASKPVWGLADKVLGMMRSARASGLDITADVYPYTYWQSTITVLIPTRDWSDRKAWAKGLSEVGGPTHVLLTTYSPDKSWQGKTLADISKLTSKDPVTVIQEIVSKTHGAGAKGSESVVVTAMTEPDVTKFIRDPHIMFCTDGGLTPSHPRAAGSFPRVLAEYVRSRHVLPLPEAIRKMTSLPAHRFRLDHRGAIRKGYFADVVVLNPLTVQDEASLKQPTLPPKGIDYVLINGQVVVTRRGVTPARPGRFLTRR